MLTSDAIGGVWTYASGLASALASRGADVHLVTMGPPPREDQRAMLSAPSVHLIETSLALEWQDPEGRDVTAARRVLGELEARLRPDIVHLNSFREAAFEWNCPTVIGAHSCVNSWAAACRDAAWLADARWRHYATAVAGGLNRAQAWVCPSRAYHDAIVGLYRPRSPGFVIWNGIASAETPPDDKDDFILAAGRMWDAAKNISALVHAAGGLDWPVLVAGPADSSQNAPPAIRLLGQVSHAELIRLMRRAAIFASPALYEPFGLSVLEAASAGCALVLSDIPSFRELWDEAALFVDPTDATMLHQALAELTSDAGRRVLLQQAAAARSRNYSLRRMIDCYVVLYQGLLAPGPKPTLTPALEASL
jgi:glycosyltransferase involved in cell wall biosynthesis